MGYKFEYFYGTQAQQYAFYMLPQVLFTEEKFRVLSTDAKVLYSLLLARASLSQRNSETFQDDDGKTYVFFKREDVLYYLQCTKEKSAEYFRELDDIGLIERKRQGQGKPVKIYVKQFYKDDESVKDDQGHGIADVKKSAIPDVKKSANSDIKKSANPDIKKSAIPDVKKSVNPDVKKSANPDVKKSANPDVKKSANPDTIYKEIDIKSEYKSSSSIFDKINKNLQKIENDDTKTMTINDVKRQICYESLSAKYSNEKLDYICEVIYSVLTDLSRRQYTVMSVKISASVMRKKFLLLRKDHIEFVLSQVETQLNEKNNSISNMQSYFISCLYNSITLLAFYDVRKPSYDLEEWERYALNNNPFKKNIQEERLNE